MCGLRYYFNEDGGWLTVSGDADVFSVVPDGYREVSEQGCNEAVGMIIVTLPEGPPAPAEAM
ncbi:hypothetical protein OG345_40025 [Streptomyces sp. NBC_01220]|uniref:hypothetical protein n=1 Tax=Streptomyces sp. NBC_01220 TaxID=2903781 RepID=UPI00352CCE8E|nr:hypothetical protein OG345_40025 [Streptomyces sp. NBC_01220]